MKALILAPQLSLLLCCCAVPAEPTAAIDFENSQDSQAIDSFLRNASPLYAAMARVVEFDGGYRFADRDGIEGGCWNAGDRAIEVGSQLKGAKRASIIVFEMTNAFQHRLHVEVDFAAAGGSITTPSEFALRHELVEYDGLRLHRTVLEEIEKSLGKLPPEFFFLSDKKPASVSEYRLPLVVDHIKQQESTGHSAYYRQWFDKWKK
jgi:urease beta subunit